MARCGCSPKCNCSFKSGTCTKANIIASSAGDCSSPSVKYSFDILVDNQTIFCGANGLEARLNTLDTNTIDLSGNGTVANPLKADVILTPNGNVPDPDALGTGNLIKELPGTGGGIYLSCEDVQDCVGAAIDVITSDCLNYNDATNTISITICPEPNGIECVPVGDPNCPAGGLAVIPSSDANNSLGFGSDGDLFAAAAAIKAGDCMTFTGDGSQANPYIMSPQIAPELNGIECVPGSGLLVTPSSDANNFLVYGGDQRLYTRRCPLTTAGSQVLIGNNGPCFDVTGGDCNTPLLATLRLSDDVCQGLECRADGLYVQVDTTALPATSENTFGTTFGPFNGTVTDMPISGGFCVSLTNPSPCRDMVVVGRLDGFADTGRTSGAFRLDLDMCEFGTFPCAGPTGGISQFGQTNPNPSSRITANATWDGNDFIIGPGATHTECMRFLFSAQAVVGARVFASQFTLGLVARWAE